jgi:hypothetical protein
MKRVPPLVLTVVLLGCSGFLYAQAWSGILAPSRAINWSHAGATITSRTTQCGSTIAAYGTSSSPQSAATINTAISNCSNGYVLLGAGTFYLNTSIISTTSNVTLRGMGPDQTFLAFMNTSTNCNGFGATSICVWNGDASGYWYKSGNTASWTANYSQGTTQITIGSPSNPYYSPVAVQAGNLVVLSQNDDSSDTGNIWFCQTYGSDGTCSEQGSGGVAKSGASQTQNVTVTAVSGSTVTISPGLYAPQWTSSKSPTAWWSNSLPITGFGIENLSVDYSNMGANMAGIEFHNATNCWVENIRSINNTASGDSTHKHVLVASSNHITVRDSYFYGSSPTSEGYGNDFGFGSADCLSENNIFQHMAAPMMNETDVGTVFGYNYAVDDYYNNGGVNWQMPSGWHHSAGDQYLLNEANEGIGWISDIIHGTSSFFTHFRCYLNGHDPATQDPAYTSPYKNQATFAYFPMAGNRYENVVGSVLGTYSYHTKYLYSPASTTDCGVYSTAATSVFVFGFSDQGGVMFAPTSGDSVQNCPSGSAAPYAIYDDTSQYTGSNAGNIMLWGNYAACNGDSACNTVRWQSSENASGAPTYPGLSSPSQTLPSSFYLSSQPSWWPSSIPWPTVGPDVSGGNVSNVGGHVYLNPAANCYLNVMGGKTDGSSGALTFNANNCYDAPAPTPAANLAAVAH